MKWKFWVAVSTVFLFACSTPKNIEYKEVKNVKLQQFGFDKSDVGMDLVYYNPNSFGVKLKKVEADIYIDHHYLGKLSMDSLMMIPRKSEFILPSKLSVDVKTVFKNALNLVLSKQVLLEVKGTTKVGKGSFYTTIPFSYEGRQRIDLF